jgi:hypothetical protein
MTGVAVFFFDKKHALKISSKKLLEPLQYWWLQVGVHSEGGTLDNDQD